jgi:hypothetical protein
VIFSFWANFSIRAAAPFAIQITYHPGHDPAAWQHDRAETQAPGGQPGKLIRLTM